jgi:hypothetical protein
VGGWVVGWVGGFQVSYRPKARECGHLARQGIMNVYIRNTLGTHYHFYANVSISRAKVS